MPFAFGGRPPAASLVSAVLVSLLMVAGPASGQSPTSPDAEADATSIAVLLTGPKNGGAWDRAGVAGLEQTAADLGVEVAFAESVDLGRQVEAFEDFADRGFEVVIGHSDAFRDGAIEAAERYPETWFVSTGTGAEEADDLLPPNFISIELQENEIGYLTGYAAGLTTQTGTVAWIGSIPLIGIGQALEGHKLGVADANPDAEVLSAFVGSFVDAAKAKEAALGFISQGADVVTHNADLAGLGVLEASQERGVWAFGHSLDQVQQAPDAVVSSVLIDFRQAYGSIVEELLAGTISGGPRSAGVADGVISLARITNVDSEIAERIEERVAEIREGSFTVPPVTFIP